MISILFVCTGNSCRSPLAEVLARREWGTLYQTLEIGSAGLHASPGGLASGPAQEVARENGLELAEHRSRDLDSELLGQYELVLTMGEGHKAEILRRHPQSQGKVFTLSEFSGLTELGDVADPWGGGLEEYRTSLEILRKHLEAAGENLRSYLNEN